MQFLRLMCCAIEYFNYCSNIWDGKRGEGEKRGGEGGGGKEKEGKVKCWEREEWKLAVAFSPAWPDSRCRRGRAKTSRWRVNHGCSFYLLLSRCSWWDKEDRCGNKGQSSESFYESVRWLMSSWRLWECGDCTDFQRWAWIKDDG